MAVGKSELQILINAKDNASGALGKTTKALKIVGVAAIAVAGASVKMAADFDKGMREVATLTPEVERNLDSLKDGVLSLSTELGTNAVESTKALYQAISAGIPAGNALDFLKVASRAAIGGVTDTQTAVDGLTTVMNAFSSQGIDAEKAADVMFATVKAGKTDFDQLSKSLFNVAPLAAATGVRFEEVTAAIATLTAQGTPTSVATTQIRGAIQSLLKPTEEMAALFQAAGFETGEAAVKSLGFAKAADIVIDATGGSVTQMTKLLGSIEGVQAILGITGSQAESFAKNLENMENSAGAATKAFEIMEDSTAQRFAKMQAKVSELAIRLGDKLLPVVNKLLDVVLGLNGPGLVLTATIGGLTAAVVALSFAMQPLMLGKAGIVGMTSGLGRLIPAVLAFGGGMGAVGVATVAVGLLAVGLFKLIEHLRTSEERALKAADAMTDYHTATADITEALNVNADAIDVQRGRLRNAVAAMDTMIESNEKYAQLTAEQIPLIEELGLELGDNKETVEKVRDATLKQIDALVELAAEYRSGTKDLKEVAKETDNTTDSLRDQQLRTQRVTEQFRKFKGDGIDPVTDALGELPLDRIAARTQHLSDVARDAARAQEELENAIARNAEQMRIGSDVVKRLAEDNYAAHQIMEIIAKKTAPSLAAQLISITTLSKEFNVPLALQNELFRHLRGGVEKYEFALSGGASELLAFDQRQQAAADSAFAVWTNVKEVEKTITSVRTPMEKATIASGDLRRMMQRVGVEAEDIDKWLGILVKEGLKETPSAFDILSATMRTWARGAGVEVEAQVEKIITAITEAQRVMGKTLPPPPTRQQQIATAASEMVATDLRRAAERQAEERGKFQAAHWRAQGDEARARDLENQVANALFTIREQADILAAGGAGKPAARSWLQSFIAGTKGGVSFGVGQKFQRGGSFMVPGTGGPDSQAVSFMASPGERVSVTRPGQGGAVQQTIIVQGSVISERELRTLTVNAMRNATRLNQSVLNVNSVVA